MKDLISQNLHLNLDTNKQIFCINGHLLEI